MKSEQKTKTIKSTIAKILAATSVISAVAWWPVVLIFFGNEQIEKMFYLIYTGWLCWFIALLCGVISLIVTKGIKETPWSKPVALAGCIIAMICFWGTTHVMSEVLNGDNRHCMTNLETLSTAIKVYCEKHDGEFPDPTKWCDLLLSSPPSKSDDKYGIYWKYFSEKSFRCPIVAEGKSGYAFNKNLAGKRVSEVDPNTVVLFETTTAGWNLNGGPEIMCPDRHKFILGESGSNVLCPNQYDVRFVPCSKVKELRWNP